MLKAISRRRISRCAHPSLSYGRV